MPAISGSNDNPQIGYFGGDAGESTGNTEAGFRCLLHEIRMTEGHLLGKLRLVERLYDTLPAHPNP